MDIRIPFFFQLSPTTKTVLLKIANLFYLMCIFFFWFSNGENMKQEFLHVTKLKQERQLLFPNEIFYFLSLLFINFPTSFYSDLNLSSFPWTQLEQKMFRLIFFNYCVSMVWEALFYELDNDKRQPRFVLSWNFHFGPGVRTD